ncbi:hypothetical protein [Streptomyces sp. NPDC054765]
MTGRPHGRPAGPAVVIDAGANPGNAGDVDFGSVRPCLPDHPGSGGVGPMAIAALLTQTVDAATARLTAV